MTKIENTHFNSVFSVEDEYFFWYVLTVLFDVHRVLSQGKKLLEVRVGAF